MRAEVAAKVMVVEDEQIMRMIIRQILKQLGVTHVREIFSGNQAWEELRIEHYDLVVTDLHMPGVDGLELLKRIRNDPTLHDVPVLVVTADSAQTIIQDVLRAGAHDYIVKPFTAELFHQKLMRIFPDLGR